MFLSKMMGDKVLHAPVDAINPTWVLDIGCGTGIVTHLMSEAFPRATCVGLDLSETPGLRSCPANVRFFEGNAEEMDKALNETLAALPDDTNVYVSGNYPKSCKCVY